MSNKKVLTGLVLLFIALIITNCNGGGEKTPAIVSMTVPGSAGINEVVNLSVDATDPNGLAVSYLWNCIAGSFSDTSAQSPTWTAPSTAATGLEIKVLVSNTDGLSVTGTKIIDVLGPGGVVAAAVRDIINNKCATCHVPRPVSHTGDRDIEQCGKCHVPFGNVTSPTHDGSTSGCTACHSTPEATHFNLRDDDDQTILAADAVDECIACHRDGSHQTNGAGLPALNNDDAIIAAALDGTLRAWIQPGGFMAKYLVADEVNAITNWVDSISDTRVLGYDPYLIASPTSDFNINGLGDNTAWNGAAEHVVQLNPTIYTASDEIRLKALYSGTYLYIRAEWADSTLSMTRSGSWIFDAGSWRHPTAASENDKQSEDRVAFLWNLTIPGFRDRYGCAVKCHGNIPGSSEFTDLNGSKADIWHAKAGRGLGVFSQSDNSALTIDTASEAFEVLGGTVTLQGVSDDKWLVWYMDIADGYDTEDSGRRGDSGSGAYSHNRNSDKSAPVYMETAPDSWSDAMVLTEEEIATGLTAGTVIVADPGDPGYNEAAVTAAWANYSALGAVVPERRLKAPSGSRGDVLHSAIWSDGVWVNEFRRMLLTGNSDDVQFNSGAAGEYPYSVAIFDNCGRGEIPPGHNTYGDGQFQILTFE